MRLRTPRSLVLAATLALPLTLVLGSCGPSTAPATPRGSAANNTTSGTGAPADSIYLGTRVAPPRHDGAIRIATYNLLNLFDDIDDPAYSGNEEDIDDAKPQSERTALGDAIVCGPTSKYGLLANEAGGKSKVSMHTSCCTTTLVVSVPAPISG